LAAARIISLGHHARTVDYQQLLPALPGKRAFDTERFSFYIGFLCIADYQSYFQAFSSATDNFQRRKPFLGSLFPLHAITSPFYK
jgi:hypothetical protein